MGFIYLIFIIYSMYIVQDWVICRVYEHDYDNDDHDDDGMELSCLDEVFLSLDDYDEISYPN